MQVDQRVQELISISESYRCVVKFLNREWPYESTQKKVLKHGDRRMHGDDSIRNKA